MAKNYCSVSVIYLCMFIYSNPLGFTFYKIYMVLFLWRAAFCLFSVKQGAAFQLSLFE